MKPILAIDYDDTYAKMPEELSALRASFQAKGWLVYIVTARCSHNRITEHDLSSFDDIVYTNLKAKASVVNADMWVDDSPISLCCDMHYEQVGYESRAVAYPSGNLYHNYQGKHFSWFFEDNKFVSYVRTPNDSYP